MLPQRFASVALLAATLTLGACAGSASFGLSYEDNNPERLAQALALYDGGKAAAPVNSTGKPLAFLVVRANKKKNIAQQLIAYSLDEKRELWRVATPVRSRLAVCRDFVVHSNDKNELVARSVTTGAPLWTVPVPGFLGAACDAERAFYVTEDKAGAKPVWTLAAVNARTGAELWRRNAPGKLGAPSARGGLVFSPFLKQWLAILDAKTGKQIARIRGDDEEIGFVRTTGDGVYFGSKSGVFLLDDRAASGRRGTSTYGRAGLPKDFVHGQYYWDAFDLVQTGYSAYDRNRLLWRGQVRGDELGFAGDVVVAYTYRFFFAFDSASGALRWAYNHPRVDAVGAAHVGPAIAFASGLGDIGALDPGTGRRIYTARVDEQLVGVTFDAEGWAPAEQGEPTSTVTALTSIARDPDARFGQVKRFAVAALAALPGADVTRDLIEMVQNERTPKRLYDKAVEALIARKEPEGLIHLIAALQTSHDYIAGTAPRGVGVIARAIAAFGGENQLDPAQRGAAVEALLANLQAPETSMPELADVIRALGAVGGGAEVAPLRAFVLAYHADPAFSAQSMAMTAAVDVLLKNGGAAERELVGFVADDPRTQATIAEHARRALGRVPATGQKSP